MYRQGDVMLIPMDEHIPRKATKVSLELGRVILAHGEVTGHHHSFAGDSGVALLEDGDDRFLRVEKSSALEHQEHGTIEIPRGRYRVIRQREYAPGEIRNVAD